jgi:hypothetical protein
LEYIIRNVRVNCGGIVSKRYVYQLLIYADYINILGKNIQTIKKTPENILVATKDGGPEMIAEKIKGIS